MGIKKCSNKSMRHIKFFLLKIVKGYMISNEIIHLLLIIIAIIKDIQELIITTLKLKIHIEDMKDNKDGIVKNIDKK